MSQPAPQRSPRSEPRPTSPTTSRTPSALASHDLSSRQAVLAAAVAMLVVIGLDLTDGRLGPLFSIGFVLVAVTAPLSVDVRSLFPTGVLPPALLIGALLFVTVVAPSAIQADGLATDAGLVATMIAGVLGHGVTLVLGHGLALGIIALRILTDPDR